LTDNVLNKAAAPLAAGSGGSDNALFAHVHFGNAEKFARASNLRFYVMGNYAISYYIKKYLKIFLK